MIGRDGDQRSQQSFDDRLRPIARRLYGYASALARDVDGAADLYQDTVMRAVASPAPPNGERQFRAWMFTIMRNHWIDQLRAECRQPEIEPLDEETLASAFVPVSLETVIVNQLAVRQAFERLSVHHRDVLTIVDVGGFSYDEAADMIGVPRGTVMSRVSRARNALCVLLADDSVAMHPATAGRPSP